MLYEVSVIVLIGFAAVVALYGAFGVVLAARLPWSDAAARYSLPCVFGVASSPFLFAFAGVLALGALPGRPHVLHLGVVLGLPLLIGALLFRRPALDRILPPILGGSGVRAAVMSRVGVSVVAAAAILLVASAAALPLTQNDALEYFTVAREIFTTKSLYTYPLLNPETNLSGFFAPWTHPPLYNAALYAAQLLQGSADSPGVARLVSAWFALAAVLLTAATAAPIMGRRSYVAAMILASTPLFFLGADSALIDSLPALGFLLFTSAVLGIDVRGWKGAAAIGATLGVAHWTHSQAVLFPMFFVGLAVVFARWRPPRQTLLLLLVGGLAAVVVGAWPYLRNIAIFGVPVSDEPLVFALPQLHFADYFQTGRGLGSKIAAVQYGIFKGWFSLEAYAWAFWLLSIGGIGLWRFQRRLVPDLRDTTPPTIEQACFIIPLFVVLAYLAGVTLTVFAGIYELIKNERYMLVILPHVCILAAAGIVAAIDGIGAKRRPLPTIRRVAPVLIATVLLGQVAVLVFYRFSSNGVSPLEAPPGRMSILHRRGEHQTIRFLREETPAESLVLSFKPADMYYAERRQVSYLDPRLLPVYESKRSSEAAEALRGLGVTFVHVPDYGIPPLYNGTVNALLRDSSQSEITYAADFNQIYRMASRNVVETTLHDLSPGRAAWVECFELKLGGRKGFASLPLVGASGGLERIFAATGLFVRDWARVHRLAAQCGEPAGTAMSLLPISGGSEYAIDLVAEGEALVKVWLTQWRRGEPLKGAFDRSRSTALFAEFVLGKAAGRLTYGRRFISLPGADAMSIELEVLGDAPVSFSEVRVVSLHPAAGGG